MNPHRDREGTRSGRFPAQSIRPRWLALLCGLLAVLLVVQLGSKMRLVPPEQGSGATAAVPPVHASSPPAATAPTAGRIDVTGAMAVPVAGVRREQLYDSYADARSGGRVHDAIDILAPLGTPVVAAAAGRIEKLFASDLGGNTIYIRSPDGRWIYYYAHLSGYRRGLREGEAVAQGALIGAVGSSGNADPAAPHLHFAVHHARPDESWAGGVAVNPYPLLTRRE